MKEQSIIKTIDNKTKKGNTDNISRTIFYESFYRRHPEIRWALLAGMVSRNAGWNMTDLESKWFQHLLNKTDRDILFSTYERANWAIFEDAYPQLLIYEWSKKIGQPLFHLLARLKVSSFMEQEWVRFWEKRDEIRLCTALIINEQHLIQKPVIEQPYYKNRVFSSLAFYLEEHAHFSYVLFPTRNGQLFGLYVRNFRDLNSRVWLGKQLAVILFHPDVHRLFLDFQQYTEHTGSRRDYQVYMSWRTRNTSPMLRLCYPIVDHHNEKKPDWYFSIKSKSVKALFLTVKEQDPIERTEWVRRKQLELYYAKKVKDWFS
jgi:hypothetical protein